MVMTHTFNLIKRSGCTGDHCPVDIPTWKIIVFSMIPVILLSVGGIYIFGIRYWSKEQRRLAAEDRFDALDWDEDENYRAGSSSTQRVDSFYQNQKPGFARSITTSSLSTVTPVTALNGAAGSPKNAFDDKESPYAYQMEEYNHSMLSVPLVKDASYILPPTDDSEDWGYLDPVTQVPGRTHSPLSQSTGRQKLQNMNKGQGS